MDKEEGSNEAESLKEREGEENGLERLLRQNSTEITAVPMDTNIPVTSSSPFHSTEFTRERVFCAASRGDSTQLHGLLDYLRLNDKRLTSPEFTDDKNGKTALLKALLNLKDGKNETVEVLLDIAERTGDLTSLINASYRDPFFQGQTALHVAIERRSFDHVKLLVQKGADVQAKANGKFFQHNDGPGFYFGELPLSLAACTNQPDTVSFLMENPHRRADVTDKDSQGNTVLHTLVIIADDSVENTDMIAKVYQEILVQHYKLYSKGDIQLEEIENNQGLTPVKLAAKLGKIGLLKHMLNREFQDEETRHLSRKFTEWVYGPVRSSLYDISSIDTDEKNSILEIIVRGSEIPNRPKMLQIEPLRSLLEDKWNRFASKLFFINFLAYLVYVMIFTTAAFYRKNGKPPFPVENTPIGFLRCLGDILSVLGGVWILYKAVIIFKRKPPNLDALLADGFNGILFFLQGALLLICTVLYFCGKRDYVGLLVMSLALAWVNILYYSRGSKQMGIYDVMIKRMILSDLLQFLCVYSVMLLGFSAAIMTLISRTPPEPINNSTSQERSLDQCEEKLSYNDIRFTVLELFKFTIGMGDLQFTDHVQSKEVFYILLISYIVLTYILLLNMLIALMGNTVERISQHSEDIWNLQRAVTILDMEKSLPKCMKARLMSKKSKRVCLSHEPDKSRIFFRVEETNWSQWRSDLHVMQEEEDPGEDVRWQPENNPQVGSATFSAGARNNLIHLLHRLNSRRRRTARTPSFP